MKTHITRGISMWKNRMIKIINDHFRRTMQGGKIVLTRGIRALPKEDILNIMEKVSTFDDFNEGNDTYGEHDYASFDYKGKKIIWKIDYYDKAYEYASEDPSDVNKTNRVLTIMLAEEY